MKNKKILLFLSFMMLFACSNDEPVSSSSNDNATSINQTSSINSSSIQSSSTSNSDSSSTLLIESSSVSLTESSLNGTTSSSDISLISSSNQSSSSESAQTPITKSYNLFGKVVDNYSLGIENVEVTLKKKNEDRKYSINTDTNGEYKFNGIGKGTYTISFISDTRYNTVDSEEITFQGDEENINFKTIIFTLTGDRYGELN